MADIERVDWDTFLSSRFIWHQGEHITLIGPTGSGKTTLALELLHLRKYVIAYGTKPKDATLDRLVKRDGWRKVSNVEKMPNTLTERNRRIVFWPQYRTPEDEPAQAWHIAQSLRRAFTDGGWCLFIDETWWFTHKLGLKNWLEALWTQGRSIGLSIVAGTQRPAHIPLLAYDQATHVFFWRDNDERNLTRISGMNGLNAAAIKATVSTLGPHEVLYVNTRTSAMSVTKAPNNRK